MHSMKFLPASATAVGGSVIEISDPRYDDSTLPEYEVFVIFAGTADEDLSIRTDVILGCFDAICKDVEAEYKADPDAAWGWSVEVHQVPRHEGDEPYLIRKVEPEWTAPPA